MTFEDVLHELIRRVGPEGDNLLAWEQVREWPNGAISACEDAGWIKPAAPATTVECPGCEENCFMPVRFRSAQIGQTTRAYVACDQRDYMGPMPILPTHLQQWQITKVQVARWVSRALGIKGKPQRQTNTGAIQLGKLQGKERLGSLEIDAGEPVSLRMSGHSLPLTEVVFFEDHQLRIDRAAVIKLVDLPEPTGTLDRYQPSTIWREARKLKTAARNESWRKEARRLRRADPSRSERWIAQRIGRMPIASKASWETIRKAIRQ